jgi:serine/threonine-protein kinase RsbW
VNAAGTSVFDVKVTSTSYASHVGRHSAPTLSFESRVEGMSQPPTFTASAPPSLGCSPSIQIEYSFPSEVAAISSFVDTLILMLTQCSCISGNEGEVETALREALNNAVVHGNHEDPRKCVRVTCLCESGDVSIAVQDEGRGFDFNKIPDPSTPETTYSSHGRGIYLMKAFMDDVRFEEGGSLVCMRKRAFRTDTRIRGSGTR